MVLKVETVSRLSGIANFHHECKNSVIRFTSGQVRSYLVASQGKSTIFDLSFGCFGHVFNHKIRFYYRASSCLTDDPEVLIPQVNVSGDPVEMS